MKASDELWRNILFLTKFAKMYKEIKSIIDFYFLYLMKSLAEYNFIIKKKMGIKIVFLLCLLSLTLQMNNIECNVEGCQSCSAPNVCEVCQ